MKKERNLFYKQVHGAWELDVKIATVRKQALNPNKRYFTIPLEGEKEFFPSLIEARIAVKERPDEYKAIEQSDIDAELATRTTRLDRSRWADVVDRDNLIAVFMGKRYKLVEHLSEAA